MSIKNINSIRLISSPRFILGFIDSRAKYFTNDTTKTVNEENIDESDEYLNINKITTHVKINKKHSCVDNTINTPKYVATPFPPLNLNQMGNICPKKTTNDDN